MLKSIIIILLNLTYILMVTGKTFILLNIDLQFYFKEIAIYLIFLNIATKPTDALRDRLRPGEVLRRGDELQSSNGRFHLRFANDVGAGGILALCLNVFELWQADTGTMRGDRVEMRPDGNLVVADNGNRILWQTNTTGRGNYAVVQDDANLVIYASNDRKLWSTIIVLSKLFYTLK